MIYTTHYDSPVGRFLLAEKDGALIGLWMEGQKYFPAFQEGETKEDGSLPMLTRTVQWLDRYFRGERPAIDQLCLAPEGSSFRKEVWKILCRIPYGQVTTYKELARQMAAIQGRSTMSAQAVGGAVGHNPISIIIPCHRVVGSDGSLTGYAGGIEKKVRLLTLEGVDMGRLYVPGSRGKEAV